MVLNRRREVSFKSGSFTPGETAKATDLIAGWVGPKAGLDAVNHTEFLLLTENRILAVQALAHPHTDTFTPTHLNGK
jgi:hypothetical protein